MTNEKVAVISGGSKGLGEALCKTLLKQGWYVYVISRTSSEKFSVTEKQMHHIKFDFTSKQSIRQMCDAITHHKVDLLVNNAGVAYTEKYSNIAIESDFEKIFRTNFLSAVALTLALQAKLVNGTVITISSDLSYVPVQGLSLYAASKSALNAWFASYAQSKIYTRFITIIPSTIDTPMLKELLGEAYIQHKDSMMNPNSLAQKVLDIQNNLSIKTNTEIFIFHPKMIHTPDDVMRNKLFWELENEL